jgi:protein SCO1
MKSRLFNLLLFLTITPVLAPFAIAQQATLPFDLNLGGPFQLVDQSGNMRSQINPNGQMQLVFFGYANCASICPVALPLMGDVVTDLSARDISVTPVMITVDPRRDTVETIGSALQKYHPDFVGLTGSPADLQKVYDLFSIEKKVLFTDPERGDVLAHGSHIYLLDAQGKFLTLLPPVLSPERIVDIVQKYASINS